MNAQPVRLRTRSAAEIRASGSFAEAQAAGRYQGYTYSYPHKTSYGWFDSPLSLAELWSQQDLSNTFLYGHIPFCEMRCGFCNLFTTTNPTADAETLFVEAFERQARIVRSLLGPSLRVTTGAIGGGTPTLLSAAHLYRVFAVLADSYGVNYSHVPFSVETSPDTASAEKVAILGDVGIERASIGIQSWFAQELRAMGRPQDVEIAHAAVARLRDSAIPKLNIDLIYGVEGQTETSMLANIAKTLQHEPDEVFLYPLYVRPLTGLGRNLARSWDDDRIALYRVGRDALLEAGFRQVSMRRFERLKPGPADDSTGVSSDSDVSAVSGVLAVDAVDAVERSRLGSSLTGLAANMTGARSVAAASNATMATMDGDQPTSPFGPSYDCQRDPMIGLGPGARSYTPNVHYSTDWAVGREGVRSIIDNYVSADDDHHKHAHYGVKLSLEDRKCRFILQGLLHELGLDLAHYQTTIGSSALVDFSSLHELLRDGLAHQEDPASLRLTALGFENSDVIGPWLYGDDVKQRMSAFDIH